MNNWKLNITATTKTTHLTLGKPVWFKLSFWAWTKIKIILTK